MAEEQSRPLFNRASPIPKGFSWDVLLKLDGDELETHYRHLSRISAGPAFRLRVSRALRRGQSLRVRSFRRS